jgi:hypothetical protein
MRAIELRLPHDVLQRATLRGNEYAWPVEYIPKVIEAPPFREGKTLKGYGVNIVLVERRYVALNLLDKY